MGEQDIKFLLDFDFKREGADASASWLEQMIGLLVQVNEQSKISGPLLDAMTAKEKELSEAIKQKADSVSRANSANKEGLKVMQDDFSEQARNMKQLLEVIGTKKDYIKTEQELTVQFNSSASMIKKLTIELQKAKIEGEKYEGHIVKVSGLLKNWTKEYINLGEEMSLVNKVQQEAAGWIEQTRVEIAELTESLSIYTKAELSSNKEALETIALIAEKNAQLKDLNVQLSGNLTLQDRINKVQDLNIKMENDLIALKEKDIELMAQKSILEDEIKAKVADRISVERTGYTVKENLLLKEIELEDAANKKRLIELEKFQEKETAEIYKAAEAQTKIKEAELQKQIAARHKAAETEYNLIWREAEEQRRAETEKANTVQKEQDRIEAIRHRVAEAEYNEIWKNAEANQKAETQKQAAQEKTIWSLDNIIKKIDFMGVRMIATMFWWGLIIGGATALYEWWTKISDAEKLAADRLKDYFDSFKDNQKLLLDSGPKTKTRQEIDNKESEIVSQQMTKNIQSGDFRRAYGQYKILKTKNQGIFDDMSEKEFFKKAQIFKDDPDGGGDDDTIQIQLNRLRDINKLKAQYATAKEEFERSTSLVNENQDKQDAVKKVLINSVRSGNMNAKQFGDTFGFDGGTGTVEMRKAIAKKLTDEEIIQKLQENFTNKEDSKNWYQRDIKNQTGYLNKLVEEQGIVGSEKSKFGKYLNVKGTNLYEQQNASEKMDAIYPQLVDLEGIPDAPKDKKAPKGPRDIRLEQERATERAIHEGNVKDIKDAYEVSGKSGVDANDKFISLQNESEEHYKKMEAILEKYEGISKDTTEKIKYYRQEDVNSKKQTTLEIHEMSNQELAEFKRYNEERFKQLREANKKFAEITREYAKQEEEAELAHARQERKKRRLSMFNSIQAFFGGGVTNERQDREDRKKELEDELDKAQKQKFDARNRLDFAQVALNKSQAQVDEDEKNPVGSDYLSDPVKQRQKKQYEYNKEANNKNAEELKSALSDYGGKHKAEKEAQANLENEGFSNKQRDKIKIAEATFSSVNKIAQSAFELERKRMAQHRADLEAQYQFENTLAGNNQAAKIRLAIAEHGKMKELRKEEAKAEKTANMFSAVTNGAVAVTKAWAEGGPVAGPILAAITAAAVLVQVATIASAPLPSYRRGRGRGKAEVARVNEDGFELIEGKDGMRVAGGGKETYTWLNEDDKVITNKESKNYLKDLLKGTGAYIQKDASDKKEKITLISQSISKDEFKQAMVEALREMPRQQAPAVGVEGRLQRTQKRNLI